MADQPKAKGPPPPQEGWPEREPPSPTKKAPPQEEAPSEKYSKPPPPQEVWTDGQQRNDEARGDVISEGLGDSRYVAPPSGEADQELPSTSTSITSQPPPRPSSSGGYSMSVHPINTDKEVILSRSLPQKSMAEAYVLGATLGMLGAHNFYLRRGGMGVVYLFTFGLCGVGWITDLFRMPCLVDEANRKIIQPQVPEKKSCADAYILWFPLGILGFHHYYLGRWGWGVAYTFTGGFFGIGWLADCVRIPSLVSKYNAQVEVDRANNVVPQKSLCDAYALGVSPLGILGAHHYYLGRYMYGLMYTFTFGLAGVGWLVDCGRMKVLVDRKNKELRTGDDRKKYLDDAYVACFPLGFLGLHHFYLGRTCWGVAYLLTFGFFMVGWLVDLCRLPFLVKQINERLEEETLVVKHLRHRMGPNARVVITDTSMVVYNEGGNSAVTGVVSPAHGGTVTAIVPAGPELPIPKYTADPNGQILQPPSYEAVFGSGPYTSTPASQPLNAVENGLVNQACDTDTGSSNLKESQM